MNKVIIIGSGAIGLCTAYYLKKEGLDVHIITSSKKGSQQDCSYGNAGLIVPSHFVPLAAPGVISSGLKWMFNSKSPFYIKPRLNLELMSWLWNFYRSANQRNVERSQCLLRDLNLLSKNLFEQIQKEENIDFNYQKKGLLMLYKSVKYQEEEEKRAEKAITLGLKVEIKNQAEVLILEPNLSSNILGGVLYKNDAHLNPNIFMHKMIDLLEEMGVIIQYETSIKGFNTHKNKIKTITTTQGQITANEFVICAGSWSSHIVKQLKVKIPLQAGKGYSLTIPDIPDNINYPNVLCEAKIAMTPMDNKLRIAGTMEIAGLNRSITKKRVKTLKEQIPNYFSLFKSKSFDNVKPWAGLRPVSPDGLPYIGKAKNWSNLTLNTGHAMMGISMAPISGKLASEEITKTQKLLDITLLQPERF